MFKVTNYAALKHKQRKKLYSSMEHRKVQKKKALNDRLPVIFRAFFFGDFQSFYYLQRKNSKNSKVNQQSVLNL